MRSACLEIHLINVGQGDSVLIINRDLDAVEQAIEEKPKLTVPEDPIDYMPYAIANGVSLEETVNAALLVDGGDDEYGGDVVDYLITHGVVNKKTVFAPKLKVLVSHYHDDHMAGLRSVFKKRVEPKKPGDKVKFKERFRPGEIYLPAVTKEKYKPKTQRYAMFDGDVKYAVAQNPPSTVFEISRGGLLKSSSGSPSSPTSPCTEW